MTLRSRDMSEQIAIGETRVKHHNMHSAAAQFLLPRLRGLAVCNFLAGPASPHRRSPGPPRPAPLAQK